MDEIQERIASVALGALARYGFVLAGGQSLQVHGLVDRPSADLDSVAAFDLPDPVVESFVVDAITSIPSRPTTPRHGPSGPNPVYTHAAAVPVLVEAQPVRVLAGGVGGGT